MMRHLQVFTCTLLLSLFFMLAIFCFQAILYFQWFCYTYSHLGFKFNFSKIESSLNTSLQLSLSQVYSYFLQVELTEKVFSEFFPFSRKPIVEISTGVQGADCIIPLQGVRVWSLVQEQKYHATWCGQKRKKKKQQH